jgi:ABC-type sugar transport system permease subunit
LYSYSFMRTIAQAPSAPHETELGPGRWLIILPPLLFLLMFFLIPFAFAFKISFAEAAPRVPPFTDVSSFTPDHHICTWP